MSNIKEMLDNVRFNIYIYCLYGCLKTKWFLLSLCCCCRNNEDNRKVKRKFKSPEMFQ